MDRPRSPVPGSPTRGAVELRLADLGHGARTVLHAVDAVAPEGAHVLVVGDNGSGKTTLLSTVAGLLPKRGGHVLVLGHEPLGDRRALYARAGHLGHRDPVYPELSGRENLVLYARLKGLGADAVATALERVELVAPADRLVATYSHGMRRRLGLAKALLGDPSLVILDEPESGLDAHGRVRFQEHLAAQPGRTVLLSTHHWADWLDWADRAWVLGAGDAVDLVLAGDADKRRRHIADALTRLHAEAAR